MLNIGPQELLVILVIALVVVGPQRLPELGRSIGHWVRELRKAQDEVKRTIRVGLDDPGDPVTRAPDTDGSSAGQAAKPAPPEIQDPTPVAGTTPSPEEVREISRSLGRSLGQLRRAREDVQRSFRVDVAAPTPQPREFGPPTKNGSLPESPPPPESRHGEPDASANDPSGSDGRDPSEG